jgi:hypothetical protein
MRLVRRGPWTACRIDHEAGLWRAFFNDIPQGPPAAEPEHACNVFHIWTWGERIDAGEYAHLIRLHLWAIHHAPAHPAARPSVAYDPRTAAPVF